MYESLMLWITLMVVLLYFFGIAGSGFLFAHLDLAYGYNPGIILCGLRSLLWPCSVMLVGTVIFLSGIGQSKGEYYE